MEEFKFPSILVPRANARQPCGCHGRAQSPTRRCQSCKMDKAIVASSTRSEAPATRKSWGYTTEPSPMSALGDSLGPAIGSGEVLVHIRTSVPFEDLLSEIDTSHVDRPDWRGTDRAALASEVRCPTRAVQSLQRLAIAPPSTEAQPPEPKEGNEPGEGKNPYPKPTKPPRDCDPWFRDISIKTFQCNSEERAELSDLHGRAYYCCVTAWRTLYKMSLFGEESQRLLWNWGDPKSKSKDLWANHPGHHPRLASLAAWFGPYSKTAFAQIFKVFTVMKDSFELGVKVGGIRYWMRYKCKTNGCIEETPIRHLVKWSIDVCRGFWDDYEIYKGTKFWKLTKTASVFHEHFHNVVSPLVLRDESMPGVCIGGWNDKKCYRDKGSDGNWASHGLLGAGNKEDGPTQLIAHKLFNVALNNVDNYTAWALQRYVSPWFGFCDIPKL